MKNLKMFAIGLAAFATMTMGVHAATATECKETDVTDTCTLKSTATISSTTRINKDITIKTSKSYGLTLSDSQTLIIEKGKTLTIDGGNVNLQGTIKVLDGGSLKIINGEDDVKSLVVPSTKTGIINVDGGTFEVTGNKATTAVVSNGTLKITLTNAATLKVSDNEGNGINGVGTDGFIKATDSKIVVENNKQSGISGRILLDGSSTLSATGNGLSGVVFAGESRISTDAVATVKDNLKDTEYEKLADKADILINGNLTVTGKLVGGKMAPLKVTWSDESKANSVKAANVKLSGDNATVNIEKMVTVCAGATIGSSCLADSQKNIAVTSGSKGVITEGTKATIYGDVKSVELGSDVTEVVVDENAGSDMIIKVAAGTKVVNKSTHNVVVSSEKDGNVIVESKKEFTATGTVDPGTTEPTPGTDVNPGSDGETQKPADESNVPKTGDSIMTFMGLGLASIAVVGLGTKNLKKQTN